MPFLHVCRQAVRERLDAVTARVLPSGRARVVPPVGAGVPHRVGGAGEAAAGHAGQAHHRTTVEGVPSEAGAAQAKHHTGAGTG